MDNFNINSSCHSELDPVKYTTNKTIFPKTYLEYFIDYFSDNNIEYNDYDSNNYCVESIIDRNILYMCVNSCYTIDNYIEDIPTIQTYISDILSESDISTLLMKKIPKLLYEFWNECGDKCIDNKYFFRLNICSPKDIGDCIVNSPTQIVDMIYRSDRLQYFLKNPFFKIRIVLRKVISPFPTEYRLFVNDLKLRAISQNDNSIEKEDKSIVYNEIVDFYKTMKSKLPYLHTIIDIIKYNGEWIVLELNPFGAENYSGSGLFNWLYDYNILYFSETPVIKFNY